MSSSDDQPGDSKEQMPNQKDSSPSSSGADEGMWSKLLDALKSLFAGGQGQAQASPSNQMGPGIIQRHNNNLDMYANPENLNPQGTPMPTPMPQGKPLSMAPPMPGGAPMGQPQGQAGIPPQMQIAMARQRLQPQQMAQPEDMSKYQRPMGRG